MVSASPSWLLGSSVFTQPVSVILSRELRVTSSELGIAGLQWSLQSDSTN